jgi:hypothetical protein
VVCGVRCAVHGLLLHGVCDIAAVCPVGLAQCVAVLAAVCGCLVVHEAVCGCPADCRCSGSVRGCVRQCADVRGSTRGQCVAVRAVVCGSACGSVVRLSSSAHGNVRLSGSAAVCCCAPVCIFLNKFKICSCKFV